MYESLPFILMTVISMALVILLGVIYLIQDQEKKGVTT